MSTEPFRVLRIDDLNPDVSNDEIRDSLLLLFDTFKFVSVKVLGEPDHDRVAYAVFRYVEDAEEAFDRHRDMVLHGKNVNVSEVFLNDSIMDVLSSSDGYHSGPEHEDDFVPRGKASGRRPFRSRGLRHGSHRQPREPPRANRKMSFPTQNSLRPRSRTLFVGGIPSCTTEQDLRRIFAPFGFVIDVARKNSYAFVKFFNLDMALHAKRSMNSKKIDGVVCRIGFGNSAATSCLWVGRIGKWTSEKEILDEFCKFGDVEKFVWPPNRNYAYVLYRNKRHAENAYDQLQGMHFGRERKQIIIDFADEEDLDSSLNYELPTDATDYKFDDDADLNDNECFDEEFDDAEFSRHRSPPDRYDYDQYASTSGAARETSDYGSRSRNSSWSKDRTADTNYSTRNRSWRGRSRGGRGRPSSSRGSWRDSDRNDSGFNKRLWDDEDRAGSSFGRNYDERNSKNYDHRSRNREGFRSYEKDDRRGFARERFERDEYDRDSQDHDGKDRRSYERDRQRSYERDEPRGYERRDERSFERGGPESPRHRGSRSYGKSDRDSGSGRKCFRSSGSRSPDFKRIRRSGNRSLENAAQPGFERGNELPGVDAVKPDPPVQSNLYQLNPLYPAPSGSLQIFPNALGAYPQSNVVHVPNYPPPSLPDAFQASTLNFYPAANQPLPDFSVPPPAIRNFQVLSQGASNSVHSNLPSPKKDIASQFPVVWSGALVLKNSAFVTNMYLLSGSVLLVDAMLKDKSADCPVLKITQRLRLDEPDKVKEVDRRVNASGRNGCSILLAVPASAEVGDVNNIIQQRPLSSLGSYLREKSVAAVIMLPPGSAPGSHTGILHAFPPCQFAHEFLKREAPQLAKDYPKDDHLLVIVMRENGDLNQ